MGRTRQQVLVLWGQDFDEAPATLFITRLRAAGLPVKLVGVSGRYRRGVHGLALLADLTLDQALRLAPDACCIIVPCDQRPIQRMENDPRVRELLAQANANGALFVTGVTLADGASPFQSVRPAALRAYAPGEDIVAFVQRVVEGLEAGWLDE